MRYVIGLLTLLALGCTSSAPENAEITSDKPPVENHQHNEVTPMVLLNNGERWQANTETATHIHRMVTYMNEFKKYKANTEYTDSCHNAGAFLKQQFDSIFIECTMKGEAHDQLHNYLMPMIEPLKAAQAADLNESYNALMDLDDHLRGYDTYFK